jgi:hypothetical protein
VTARHISDGGAFSLRIDRRAHTGCWGAQWRDSGPRRVILYNVPVSKSRYQISRCLLLSDAKSGRIKCIPPSRARSSILFRFFFFNSISAFNLNRGSWFRSDHCNLYLGGSGPFGRGLCKSEGTCEAARSLCFLSQGSVMLGGSSERILFVLGKGSGWGSRRIRSSVFDESCTIFQSSVH